MAPRHARLIARNGARLLLAFVIMPACAGPLVLDSGTRQVTLLELYTSQGCSSCPPAERWLNGFVDDDDLWKAIVPVALHVDYWDYLGWQDPYATTANGERQRELARAGRASAVYTPGFFVNGREWRGWTLRLPPRASGREPGRLGASIDNNVLTATFTHDGAPLELHVAVLGFGIDTDVERGENRNRSLRQEFVALSHDVHTSPDGHWRVALPDIAATAAKRLGIALWVSASGDDRPLQATGGWLQDMAR
jgi:hypothetical protein